MKRLLILSLFAVSLFGQGAGNIVTLAPTNVANGASLPATCTVGNVFFLTGVSAGANWYGCTSTDTWTQEGSGGGGGGVTSVATTAPLAGGTITGTGTLTCTTCGTIAGTATSNGVMLGGGGKAMTATAASTTTSNILFATATAPAFRNMVQADLPTTTRARGISFTVGDPGLASALVAGNTTTDYVTVPFACTISAYNLLIDAGTIQVKFWKVATGTAIPTAANAINTSGVSTGINTAIHSTTLTDFTATTVTKDDIMAMNITGSSGARFVNGVLQCDQ